MCCLPRGHSCIEGELPHLALFKTIGIVLRSNEICIFTCCVNMLEYIECFFSGVTNNRTVGCQNVAYEQHQMTIRLNCDAALLVIIFKVGVLFLINTHGRNREVRFTPIFWCGLSADKSPGAGRSYLPFLQRKKELIQGNGL